jgi:hypothetical protein
MENKTQSITNGKKVKTNAFSADLSFSKKAALIIHLPVQKKLPAPEKEFPICNWKMPPEPEGYIRGHENDCL